MLEINESDDIFDYSSVIQIVLYGIVYVMI